VLFKVLEHCILNHYSKIFVTSDNQFGFKKESGCPHVIYMLRCITDFYMAPQLTSAPLTFPKHLTGKIITGYLLSLCKDLFLTIFYYY